MGAFLVKPSVTTQRFTQWILRTLYLPRITKCVSPKRDLHMQDFKRTRTKALQREVQLRKKFRYVCPRAKQEKGSSQISGVL